jgi:hypothetical protein
VDESTIADELSAAAQKYTPCGVTIGCYPYYEESSRDRGVRTCPSARLSRADESQPTHSLSPSCDAGITSFRLPHFFASRPRRGFLRPSKTTRRARLFNVAPLLFFLLSFPTLLLFSISQARTIVLVEGKSKPDVAECVEEILGKTPSAAVVFSEEGGHLGEPSHRRLSVP